MTLVYTYEHERIFILMMASAAAVAGLSPASAAPSMLYLLAHRRFRLFSSVLLQIKQNF